MHYYPESLRALIREIAKLPGIGEKTAERLALHLLRTPRNDADALARSIVAVREKTRLCAVCFGLSDGERCRLCADPGRDRAVICVVETPGDLIALEKSGAFRGLYHVLGGALAPMDGIGPDKLRIRSLMERLGGGAVTEVVLATSTSVEGEATAAYLADQLATLPVRVTRIASGVPMGGDLKYVDQVTLKKAMEARRAVER